VVLLDRVAAQDAVQDLPVVELRQPLLGRDHLAVGGEDAGDVHKVVLGYLGVPQGFLEARQLFLVAAEAFRKKNFFGYEV
jgi:hypothetical protein